MIIEDITEAGISVNLDLPDVKLLRDVLASFDPHLAGADDMKYIALTAMGAAFHAAAVACEAMPEDDRSEILQNPEAVRVRCKCGRGWTLLQIPDQLQDGETWPCFRWYDAETGREVHRCTSCGEPTSAVSFSPC
jgi:hypothetical protein